MFANIHADVKPSDLGDEQLFLSFKALKNTHKNIFVPHDVTAVNNNDTCRSLLVAQP